MIVIVAGMHRSGTSALAGMLHQNGIIMGSVETFYPPPRPENPKGFYENVTFRRINDTLLAARKYYVKSFSSDIPDEEVIGIMRLKRRMEKTIRKYDMTYSNWGWKDPRTCLTIHIWMDILKKMGLDTNTKIINIIRNIDEVAVSMIRRGNEGSLKKFKNLAIAYQRSFENNIKEYGFLQIDFHDLVNKKVNTVRRIEEYIGLKIVDSSFIEPRLVNRETIKGNVKWI